MDSQAPIYTDLNLNYTTNYNNRSLHHRKEKVPRDYHILYPYVDNKKDLNKLKATDILLNGLEHQKYDLKKMGLDNQVKQIATTIKKVNHCKQDLISFNLEYKTYKNKPYRYRCHHKLCPICFYSNRYKSALKVFNLIYKNTITKPMYGVFTFSPKNPSFNEFKPFIDKLKQTPKYLFKKKKDNKRLNEFVDGSIRVIETIYDHYKGFHPHMHLFLHLTRSITKAEAKEVYDLIGQRFLQYMELDESQMCLSVYESNPENFKRTTDYLVKFKSYKNISESIPFMKKEAFAVYLKAYNRFRGMEYAGCLRGNKSGSKGTQYKVPQAIKELYDSIKIEYGSKPVELYRLESIQKNNNLNIDA